MIKTHMRIILLIVTMVLCLTQTIFAIGECGAQFLKIAIGARACAMGQAYVSISDDPSALYYNPAGIAKTNKFDLLIMHDFWLTDMNVQYLGFVAPTKIGVLGASGIYSNSGKIEKYENFEKTGEYEAHDLALGITYARTLLPGLLAGITIKGIQQKIENESAQALAGDIGVLYNVPFVNGLSAGLSLLNIGKGIRFIAIEDPLPTIGRIGASYNHKYFLISADLSRPRDYDFKGNFGAEINVKKILFLRAGYNTGSSFSAGAGLSIYKFEINYAYLHQKYLDASHLVDLRFSF